MKPLTIILVAHNRLELTKRTIDSLFRTVPQAKIVVFDNASTEAGMVDYLLNDFRKREPMQTAVVEHPRNEGWACAVNKSLGALKGIYTLRKDGELHIINPSWLNDTDYILVSNNDVEYQDGWYEKLVALYEKYPQVGVMGVWKHKAHGVSKNHGDLLEKDDMPAVGWLMKKVILDEIGPIPERGPCSTKGGNGEDSNYVNMVRAKGYWIAAPTEDVAIHLQND